MSAYEMLVSLLTAWQGRIGRVRGRCTPGFGSYGYKAWFVTYGLEDTKNKNRGQDFTNDNEWVIEAEQETSFSQR